VSGTEITRKKSIEILANEAPHYLTVRIFGTIDGAATITDPWGLTNQIGPGQFDLQLANEYYDLTANIKYSPTNVRSGTLTVQYDFETY
jgi:hypothetical protein